MNNSRRSFVTVTVLLSPDDSIKSAIGELESKSVSGVEQGLKDLGSALDALKTALTDCKASSADIAEFVKTVEDGFKHPLSFICHIGKDLIVNGQDIFSEISQAISLWKSESYRDSGIQIGKALEKLIIGNMTHVEAGTCTDAADHAVWESKGKAAFTNDMKTW